MSINVSNTTSAYTNTISLYDGYEFEKNDADNIKNRINNINSQSLQDHSKSADVVLSCEGLKALNESKAILKSGIIQDDNYYNAMISNRMPSIYGEKDANGEYERKNISVSDDADNLLKAYAEAYDEIEKGYADGTRIAYVQDDTSETGYRQLTKEEEIEKLNKAYEKQVKAFGRRNDPKIVAALEETAKKIEKIKSSQSKGVTSDSIEELEKRRVELDKLPKDMGKSFFDAAKLFTERFNAQKPGTANLADILSGISVFGTLS